MTSFVQSIDSIDSNSSESSFLVDDLELFDSDIFSLSVDCAQSELGGTSTEGPQQRKKRRRKQAPKLLTFRKVVKYDVRKRISNMFLHLMNLHDLVLMHQFLSQYSLPQCQLFDNEKIATNWQTRPPIMTSFGVDAIIQRFAYYFEPVDHLTPDAMTCARWMSIRQHRSYGGSEVYIGVSFIGTKLFEYVHEEDRRNSMDGFLTVIPVHSQSEHLTFEYLTENEIQSVCLNNNSSVIKSPKAIIRARRPFRYECKSSVRILLDDQDRIVHFRFGGNMPQPRMSER